MPTISLYQHNLEKSQEAVSDLGLEMALKLSELRQHFLIEQMDLGKHTEVRDRIQVPSSLGRGLPARAGAY